jgi:DNA modification methylase
MKDRCTRSHETIFMLTKSSKYYFDHEAIQEPAIYPFDGIAPRVFGAKDQSGTFRNDIGNTFTDNGRRNKRSVWSIATTPFPGAHFAVFPEEIPKICILAGSRLGDTVLDPFAGTGTTGRVALELGRKPLLIELSPAYIEIINERTNVTPGFL